MATTALGRSYVLTEQGVDELLAIDAGQSAPMSAPGFVSQFVVDKDARRTRLRELEAAVRDGARPIVS